MKKLTILFICMLMITSFSFVNAMEEGGDNQETDSQETMNVDESIVDDNTRCIEDAPEYIVEQAASNTDYLPINENNTVIEQSNINQEVTDQSAAKSNAEEEPEAIFEEYTSVVIKNTEETPQEESDEGDRQYFCEESTFINPDYASFITEDDLLPLGAGASDENEMTLFMMNEDGQCTSMEEIALQLRTELMYREVDIAIPFYLSNEEYDAYNKNGTFFSTAYNLAVEHTGNAFEGDYIHYNFKGFRASTSGFRYSDHVECTTTITVTYYSDASQEEALQEKVFAIADQLDLYNSELTDYQKIVRIYDYLAKNTTYDNSHGSDYNLKYSTYACLVDQTCVCQGFASAFYTLALMADVDVRVVAGLGGGGNHAWNIVKMGDKYYNVDITWDETCTNSSQWNYFMLPDETFYNHIRGDQTNVNCQYNFNSADWYARYPMGNTKYFEEKCINCNELLVLTHNCPKCQANNEAYITAVNDLKSLAVHAINNSQTSIAYSSYRLRLNNNNQETVNLLNNATELSLKPEVNTLSKNYLTSELQSQVNMIKTSTNITTDNYQVFDINMALTADDQTVGYAEKLPLKKMFTIPLNLENGFDVNHYFYSTFRMYRLHDGILEEIPLDYDPETVSLVFNSDKYSTYLLGYDKSVNYNSLAINQCPNCLEMDNNNDGLCDNANCKAIIDGIAGVFSKAIVFNGAIELRFKLQLSDSSLKDPNSSITFKLNGRTKTYKLCEGVKQDNGTYAFIMGTYANEMTDEIEYYVTANGKEGKHFTYSVIQYCNTVFADPVHGNNQKLVKLLKEMLNYGGYTQQYCNYNLGNLANAGIESESLNQIGADTVKDYRYDTFNMENSGIERATKSITLGTTTGIKFKYLLKEGENVDDYEFKINGVKQTPVLESARKYVVLVDNIDALRLGEVFTATVSKNGKVVSETKYSCYSYIYTILSEGTYGQEIEKVVKALYLYGQATKAYVGN